MRQMDKKYIILGSLCAIVLMLTVGYAAFSSVLKIKGTTNISSNWDVRITGITSEVISGTPTNKEEPTYDNTNGLSATFKTNLEEPEDIMEYEIKVSNEGTINAILDKIILTGSTSNAIKFETSGLQEGDILKTGESKTLKVKVEYLKGVALDKNNMSASLTVTLEYSQLNVDDNKIAYPTIESSELKELATTSGDGLYADTYENGRYVYKGANPDNYIEFNDELWRIISVENDETLKIMKTTNLENGIYDQANTRSAAYCSQSSRGCNVWGSKTTMLNSSGNNVTAIPSQIGGELFMLPTDESQMAQYLNDEYYNTLTNKAKTQIDSHLWNVGVLAFDYNNTQTLEMAINQEKSYKWRGNVGLINTTDYIKASTNTNCTNVYSTNNGTTRNACGENNYLHLSDIYWTMTPGVDNNLISSGVWIISFDGSTWTTQAIGSRSIYPALYLKSPLTLTGSGTADEPYIIVS